MKKKVIISILILALGCVTIGSIVSFSKGEAEEKVENKTKENTSDFYYNYGVNIKDYAIEKTKQENIISKKNIEAIADALVQAGDERSKEDIIEGLEERQKRDQANYLKAVEEGFVVTDEEIEEAIEETKEAIKGEAAEKEIEAYCEGADITIEEYWEFQKEVYRKNYLINKYMAKCQEEFSALSGTTRGVSGDFSEEFKRISEENVKEFGVVVE